MAFWLMKTEPDVFSFDDLTKAPQATTGWEGVRNYQARNLMRDQFKVGDKVFVYHSNAGALTGIVGIAKVVRSAYPDPTALNPKSRYYDPKSTAAGESRWVMVDIKAEERFSEVITLAQLRELNSLAEMALLQPGQRLSVQPVTPAAWKIICGLMARKSC